MKKLLGILVLAIIIFAIAFIFLFGKGFGFGDGTGDGEGNESSTEQNVNTDEKSETPDETEENKGAVDEITILIEVKQSQYLVDGKEVTLSEIESLIADADIENTSFILEDNYASSKAWDEIKNLFTSYEISVIEQ